MKRWRDEGWRSEGVEKWRDEETEWRVTTDCMSFNLLRNKNCNSICAAT